MVRSNEGFLWKASKAVSGLETNAVVTSTLSSKNVYDAIIVGAGFAGLIAARDLAKARLSVLLVEARDRIGGRTWTAKAFGEEFEMGGTWVHWCQPHLYTELCRYGLHRNLKTSQGMLQPEESFYKPAHRPMETLSPAHLTEMTERVAEKAFSIDGLSSRELMPYPHDPLREPAPWKKYDHITIRQRLDMLDLPQKDKDMFETLTNSLGNATGSEIGWTEALRWYALSGHSLDRVWEAAGVYKLDKGGMTSLAKAMLADYTGDILVSTQIAKIEQDSTSVTLTSTMGRAFRARHAVCTIPLNVLSSIQFWPPLSSLRQEATRKGHINKGSKIHFKLRTVEPAWFSAADGYGDSAFCFAFSDHNGNTASVPDSTYCIAFGFNDKLTDASDSSRIISHFKKNLRPTAQVEAYLTHDWAADPYALGAWSCWGPNTMTKYLEELQKAHGRVFMASADWANGWRGFIDGAIESGTKAAMDVRKAIKVDDVALKARI